MLNIAKEYHRSGTFCGELTLEVNSTRSGASVYLITDTPPLADRNSFTISTLVYTSRYRYWSYYLYPDSNFTTSLLASSSLSSGVFTLVKGQSSFQKWVSRNRRSDRVLNTFNILCRNRGLTHRYSFQARDEDDYYFIYEQDRTCRFRDRRPGSGFFRSQVNISLSRFQYSTTGLTDAPTCSAIAGGQCSLNIPADLANYSALIVTNIPNDNNWEENINIRLHCSSNRGWAYAVVVLVPLLLVVGVIITTDA